MYRVVIEKLGFMTAGSGVGRTLQGAALTGLRDLLYSNEELSVLEQRGALWLSIRADRIGMIAHGAPSVTIQHKASGMRLEAHRLSNSDGAERYTKQERIWASMEGLWRPL